MPLASGWKTRERVVPLSVVTFRTQPEKTLPLGADRTGTVSFSPDTAGILLNGTAVPGGEAAEATIVLYDSVLQRPVVTVWVEDGELHAKEFTSDIIDNYK